MAWDDIWKKIKRMAADDDDMGSEDPFGEGGEMESTASSPEKANLAKARIKIRQDVGPEAEGRYARSAEYEIDKGKAEDAIEKRRAIASTRNLKPGATSEEAMAAIKKAGGLDAYWKSMSMADESERKAFEKKLRRYLDGLDDEDDELLGSSGTVRMYPKARQEAESAANRAE